MTVVVTGAGVWSGLGTSVPSFGEALFRGLSPAVFLKLGAQRTPGVLAPDPPPVPGFPQARKMDRSVQLGLAAALEAHRSAALSAVDPERVAVLVGYSRGPVSKWVEAPPVRLRPTQVAHSAIAALSGALSLALPVRGPSLTVSAACASGAHAMALGAMLLQTGEVDAVIAGGAEAPLVGPLLDQFHAAGLVGAHRDPRLACRPFDRSRNGIVPGEGAAFLVLEREEHARARGIAVRAELAGWAIASEAHNRVSSRPDGEALSRVIRGAMQRARLEPAHVGYINAHGTGTRVNDAAEAAAIRAVFGPPGAAPGVSSTKPLTGHAFGAAPALEAVVALAALERRLAPPTWGCLDPDPSLSLNLVLGAPRPLVSESVLSLSLGFWGNVAALVFRPPTHG